MNHSQNAHVTQCMIIQNHLNKKPSQKFCKNLIKLEKPQKFSKNPKLRLENMKCMIE